MLGSDIDLVRDVLMLIRARHEPDRLGRDQRTWEIAVNAVILLSRQSAITNDTLESARRLLNEYLGRTPEYAITYGA